MTSSTKTKTRAQSAKTPRSSGKTATKQRGRSRDALKLTLPNERVTSQEIVIAELQVRATSYFGAILECSYGGCVFVQGGLQRMRVEKQETEERLRQMEAAYEQQRLQLQLQAQNRVTVSLRSFSTNHHIFQLGTTSPLQERELELKREMDSLRGELVEQHKRMRANSELVHELRVCNFLFPFFTIV